jgi:hypothetical protein
MFAQQRTSERRQVRQKPSVYRAKKRGVQKGQFPPFLEHWSFQRARTSSVEAQSTPRPAAIKQSLSAPTHSHFPHPTQPPQRCPATPSTFIHMGPKGKFTPRGTPHTRLASNPYATTLQTPNAPLKRNVPDENNGRANASANKTQSSNINQGTGSIARKTVGARVYGA